MNQPAPVTEIIEAVAKMYGAHYWHTADQDVYLSPPEDYYAYAVYIGSHEIELARGESLIFIDFGKETASWICNDHDVDSMMVQSAFFAVKFEGYKCGYKCASLREKVNLPYINGCATKQIFPPERPGDPTFQQLTIPPYTSEQAHHIHPTARAVYVLKGEGYSIVGQGEKFEETKLMEGMTVILDPLAPHHFRTEDSYLTVLPVHVFSSIGNIDENHPMRNGTKEV